MNVGRGLPRRTTQDAPTTSFNEVHPVTVNFVWRVFAASCGGLPSLNLLLPKCTT